MIGNAQQIFDYLTHEEPGKLYELKERKRKRSLNANAYAWALISEMAEALRASKDDVYLMMLRRYGQSSIISVLENVDLSGFVKYYEVIGRAELQGKKFVHYRLYKGSSEYDTREMALLIDGIVSEAKEMDIETLPEHELERLKEGWKA